MGYPFFSWKPHQAGAGPARNTIDLTESLSDLQVTPRRDVADSFGIHGGRSRELLRPWVDVRIVLDRFNDRKLFRQFSAMINHLERGGSVAFCNDSDKVFLARTLVEYPQHTTSIELGPKDASAYTTVPNTLANGDEIVIESGPPAGKREYHVVNAHTESVSGSLTAPTTITLGESRSFRDDYPAGSVVRYSDFYPALILGPGQTGGSILTHDHRITYTFDILLSTIQPLPDPDSQGGIGNDADKPDWTN
jgi:hypothetical protein